MASASVPFGALLRRHRAALGLTQEEIAERAGLSVRGISDLERGARERPHLDTVELLADALALSGADRARFWATARAGAQGGADATPTNLPSPPTAILGRAGEIAAVAALIERPEVRLLTLTGPGGVGKTRLAIHVASEARTAFPDGVYFVPLAALREPSHVMTTIAHTLGLADASGEPPPARLAKYLRTRRLLLALDNFEHLLSAAPAIGELLARCPSLMVLATSRAPLRLTGEHEYPVPPLGLPERPQKGATLGMVVAAPAAALFLARLAAYAPRLRLTDADAPAVATICARLDGLPLAIELAAARARHLGLDDLAVRLQRRLPVLTHGPRDLPPRQQTLRATIAWSEDLLTSDAQRLFRLLAVFAGGWTTKQAISLCQGEAPPAAVEEALDALVDSNLVQVEHSAEQLPRYTMLATIREFAEERLGAGGGEEWARRRHADVTLAFTDQAERGLQSGERTVWSRAATAELDNVRAALHWSLTHDAAEHALRIVGNLDWFWDAVARDREGWAWSQAALAMTGAEQHGWGYARALFAAGSIAWNVSAFEASTRLLTESVARFRTLDDRRSLGQALMSLGLTALYQGKLDTAHQHVAESVALFETVDDRWNLGLALFSSGETQYARNPAAARAAYERSLAVFRSVGDPWGIAHALTGLGGLAMRAADYVAARRLMEEALALRRSVNNPGAIATSLTSLGELARREGDDDNALPYLEDGLARFRELGDAEHVAWTLRNLALVATRRGDWRRAMATLAECLTLRVEQGNPAQIAKTFTAIAHALLPRGEAEQAARLWGAAQGIRASSGEATPADEDGADELELDARLRATLGAARAADAVRRGRELTLAEAISAAQETLARRS
ncbi:MAG TPA: tetratricopeptide repeat protein [Ktedonobacterales bacterium]|nr:tetratricopeptide repeat protein [Ktedonobacterales bacterium]